MQVRRLITVLNKMIKDDPSIAYAQVAVYAKAFKSECHAVRGFNEHALGVEYMPWDNGMEVEEPKERAVLVLGADQFRCDFK